MKFQAVIFDLDGVLVSTDEQHFLAWEKLCKREDLSFDRVLNEKLRGVSRRESLQIILDANGRQVTEEVAQAWMQYKNDCYLEAIEKLTPADVLPGALAFCETMRGQGAKLAIGSSSKNARIILRNVGLGEYFDALSDGTLISRSKPFPDVFLKAAELLGIGAEHCLVVEDAEAGVDAAHAAGMQVLALSSASCRADAEFAAESLQAGHIGCVLSEIMK